MIEITVNRGIWHRGKEAAEKDAFIYNSETGKMDIIGILFNAVGVSKPLMNKTRLPSVAAHMFLPNKRKFEPPLDWLVTGSHADTPDTIELIRMNDDPAYKDEEREEKITTFLRARNIAVVFYNADDGRPAPKPRRSAWMPDSISIGNDDDL